MKSNGPKFILTFEWHSLRRDLLKNLWLILLTGCVAFMGIYIAQHSAYAPAYTSQATLAVRVKNGTASTIDNLSASADTAGIYASVFAGDSMKNLAAANLGLDSFPGQVQTSIATGINLMTISVTADDPELAYHLLTSILTVYPQISDAIFSNAVIDTLEAPQMPEKSGNRLSRTYQAALILLAMAVETGLIVLLSLLRETVKHERAFDRMVDNRLLGTITHEKSHLPMKKRIFRKKGALLIDSAFSSLRFSEDYQKLATKLEYLKRNQNAGMFAITSVSENEGKSTITVNLAMALAERGYQVAVLDLDLRKPSLYKVMAHRGALTEEFSDVLSGKLSPEGYRFWSFKPGVLAALSSRPRRDASNWLGSDRTREILDGIRKEVDFVLIDTPPTSVSADAAALVRMADRAILTVRTDHTTVADINDTITTLTNVGGNLAGCILNDVYRPFTFWGQMGAGENGTYYGLYYSGKSYGRKQVSGSSAILRENQTMDGSCL